jgi:hypothetical protein
LPEEEARLIAMDYGVLNIEDASPTIDGDWEIEGTDGMGAEVELIIDGTTGAVERAEVDTH